MLLAVAAFIAAIPAWVPMRWHSADPKSLDLLAGSPVNCLVLEAAWSPDFIQAAHHRGIAVLGLPSDPAAVDQAQKLKLDAVVFEGRYDAALPVRARTLSLTVIELPNRRGIRFDSHDRIVGTSQSLWPGIEIEHGGKTAGPTSSPWINTNGGFLRFVRGATDATVWVGVRPPRGTIFPMERYAQAIGDAALVGARWIVALDADLEQRLLARDPEALKQWKTIASYLTYYESHPEWRDYRAYSRMAVIQDASNGGLLSGSLLDMLSSQRSSVRVVPPNRLDAATLKGAHVVLDVDPDKLTDEQRKMIDDFVNAGGTLINPPAKWRFPDTSDDQVILERRQADKLQSLWEVTYNATVRKNFGARTFNTVGVLSSVLASPKADTIIVHMLNFADFVSEDITVHVLGKWKKARLYRLEGAPVDLPVFDIPEGTGVAVPRLLLMATLRFE